MELRRYKDIIAIKISSDSSSNKAGPENYVAYHSRNLEVAEVTPEAFLEMTPITLKTSEAPTLENLKDTDAREQIESWNNDENFQGRKGEIKFGIRAVTINVTQICNLKCHYCAAGGDGTYGDPVAKISIEKTLPQLKFFIDQLKENQKFTISFVGGEPLLYPEAVLSIYDYVLELQKTKTFHPIFSLTTNATLITDRVRDIIRKMKIHITVSLDGDEKTNDIARPSKDGSSSTKLTEHGLQQLSKIHNDIGSFGISAVATKENITIPETYKYFKTFNPDWYEFNFSYIEKDHKAQTEYLKQMNQIAKIAYAEGGETELRKIKSFDLYFKLLDDQQRIENHCGAGKSYLMIDARNQVYTCPWVVGEKDEVVGQGSVLNHQKLEKYQKPLIELNNCQTCWAKYLCGGGCMFIHRAHTGDKHTKDSLFCERTRGLILTTLVYYKLSRE
jgi:uncharacterized protein